MKRFFILFLLGFSLIACKSKDMQLENTKTQFMQERLGILQYKKGNYEAAFNQLRDFALLGYKESQYFIAFMFLKGQHVRQSTVIGMGWLGVAKESGIKDWIKQYNDIYTLLDGTQKALVDSKVEEYRAKYGMKAQDVTCDKIKSIASARATVNCHKGNRLTILHDIELVESSDSSPI